jgi:phosphoglycerate dehydrogenase-like enzyme
VTLRILVLARSDASYLAPLRDLDSELSVAFGTTPEECRAAAAAADVIVNAFAGRALLEAVWAEAPRVRWVHSLSAGLDHLLFPGLVESPVPLTNSRGVFSDSLGEFALAGLLAFAKDLRRMYRSQSAGTWDPFDVGELRGATLGIVGYGDIGRAVAQRARSFGMRILALRRRIEQSTSDPLVDEVLPFTSLLEMLPRCDAVVLSAPLTPQTRGLIGAAALAAMKGSAVLVNIGRGALVDEAALISALEQRRIAGAALDVFETEPLPAGHPFYRLENVLLSPHCADHTPGWRDATARFFIENLDRFRRGAPLENVIDKKRGY